RLAQCLQAPTGGRDRPDSADHDAAHAYLRRSRAALAPPNPKELLSTHSGCSRVGSRTTGKSQSASSSREVLVGGNHPSASAIRHTTASIAPAAPSKWPILDFVELTGTRLLVGPSSLRMASASAASFNGVPVPCALM